MSARRGNWVMHIATGVMCLTILAGVFSLVTGRMVRAQGGPSVSVGPRVPVISWQQGFASIGSNAPSGNNAVDLSPVYLPVYVTFGNITVDIGTGDGSNNYSWGLYSSTGTALCTVAVTSTATTGANKQACSQGTVTLTPGFYVFMFTGNATTMKLAYSGSNLVPWTGVTSSTTSSGGAAPSTVSLPTSGSSLSGYATPAFVLN
jgi:hypothetical protein